MPFDLRPSALAVDAIEQMLKGCNRFFFLGRLRERWGQALPPIAVPPVVHHDTLAYPFVPVVAKLTIASDRIGLIVLIG